MLGVKYLYIYIYTTRRDKLKDPRCGAVRCVAMHRKLLMAGRAGGGRLEERVCRYVRGEWVVRLYTVICPQSVCSAAEI